MHRVVGERDLEDTRLDGETARTILRDVVRARRFDERALALQKRGWMSGYPPYVGQEGSQVGAAHAMAEGDWLLPTYRANAMQIARGVPMTDILVFRRGHPEYASGHDEPIFPEAVTIGTQVPQATGLGMAMAYEDADDAVVCYFGDGATSSGDFHEGMNFAGVFGAPVVFFCENNGWAISMPAERQTAADSIASKAQAYGFEGRQVDGNDAFAVYEAMAGALEGVRDGDPILLESLTYRQGAHTTADDPSRYRSRTPDLPAWRTADPLPRAEEYLRGQGVIDEGFVEEAREAADVEIDTAIEEAESVVSPDPDDVFDHVFATSPPEITHQRDWLHAFLAEHGDDFALER